MSKKPALKMKSHDASRAPPPRGSITISFNLPIGRAANARADCETLLQNLFPSGRSPDRSQLSSAAVHASAFIRARCERDPAGSERASRLLDGYAHWARANDAPAMSEKRLSGALKELGFCWRKSSVIFWCGLRLRSGPIARSGS